MHIFTTCPPDVNIAEIMPLACHFVSETASALKRIGHYVKIFKMGY